MKISVIIPTYQGAHKIINCMEALSIQTFSEFELIVAIDGSTDSTEQIVNKFAKRFKNLKILKQDNLGRSVIRNTGAKDATGDLLIFYDDDMIPSSNSIELHRQFHLNNNHVIVQGSQHSEKSPLTSDFQKYKFALERIWEKTLINTQINLNSPYLSAAHFSIPRKLFLEHNGFDENLKDGEDFDLAIRLLQSDYTIIYDPNNNAIHNDPITCKSYIVRKRQYAESHRVLKQLYPKRYMTHDQRQFVKRQGWKALVYKIVSSKALVKMIDREHPLIMTLPQTLRYKLYDTVVQGLSNYYPSKKI